MRLGARRVVWGLPAAAIMLFSIFTWLAWRSAPVEGPLEYDDPVAVLAYGGLVLMYPTLGALIVSRHPRNAIGWMFSASGIAVGLALCTQLYAELDIYGRNGVLPGGEIAWWMSSWLFPIGLFVTPIFLLLLFPTGRPQNRFWRNVVRVGIGVVAVGFLGEMVKPGRVSVPEFGVDNPFAAHGVLGDVAVVLGGIAQASVIPFFFLSLTSVVLRLRRARGHERQQLKWFAFVGGLMAVLFAISFTFSSLGSQWLSDLFFVAGGIALLSLPIASAIAILKHRLYDIDVVINKTLVFGGLGAFITAVYVAIVVGIGTLIGQGDEPNLGLSIAATAVVAVAFQPVRERVQRFANRLVYGKRATPYEVLSEFSDRVAETYATEDVLPRMAKTVAEGTGAAHAEVWLRSGEDLRRAAAWPSDDTASESLAMSNGSVPEVPGVDRVIEVRHQGELLGALAVTKPAGEPLTPAEDKLLSDLAGQAGLVLRNVGLTSELLARLEELKASRQRLVAAQDEERRRLERNLHDGAQQHLVALKMKLNLAKRLAKDNDKLETMLGQLLGDADEALETLRDLARGIYPPLLADQGLKAALESQRRKASVPVTVEADGLARYPQEVEAAVYFCVLEALQNVAKYANASRAWVSVSEREGELAFEVRDDGSGFDAASTPKGAGTTNMSDRIESLGGSLEVRSHPGEGTTVAARVPARALDAVS